MPKIHGNNQSTQSLNRSRGNPPPQQREGDIMHTVKRGDTMSAIARQNNMSLRELTDANPQIQNPSRIWPGDQIRIPTMSHAPQTNPAQQYSSDGFSSSPAPNMCTPSGPAHSSSTAGYSSPLSSNDSTSSSTSSTGTMGAGMSGGSGNVSSSGSPTRADGRETTSVDDRIGQGYTLLNAAYDGFRALSSSGQMDDALRAAGAGGSRLGRVLGPLGVAVTAGTTAYNQVENANTQTTAGTATQTVAATGLNTAFSVANPVAAVVDAGLGAVGLPTLTGTTSESINQIATLTEGVATGDTRGMENIHQDNLSGENGAIFQHAGAQGEVLSGYIDVATTGDTRALDNYQDNALAGNYGQPARILAETGEFWADNSVGGALSDTWDGVGYLTGLW